MKSKGNQLTGFNWKAAVVKLYSFGLYDIGILLFALEFTRSSINCLFVHLLNFLRHFLPSLLSFFLMLSFLLIYFPTRLLPDLSVYSFQNTPVPFPSRRSLEAIKPGSIFWVNFMYSIFCYRCMFAFVVLVFIYQY